MIKPDELQSLQSGHRARLRQKFLDGKLSDYELLELLLTYAIPRRDVRVLARQLCKKYGSVIQVLEAPVESLLENEGIKENTVAFFKLIHKLMCMDCEHVLTEKPIFHNYDTLCRYCKLVVGGKPIEEFHVLYLDTNLQLIEDETHSVGTVNWSAVYVREIVKRALDLNARSVVLLHNHPTPNMSFSQSDIDITKELEIALSKVKIEMFDHMLVSGDVIYSARNDYFFDRK